MTSIKDSNGASRSAIREYAEYLRMKGYATNDSGQLFPPMKRSYFFSASMCPALKKTSKAKAAKQVLYTFSFLDDLIRLIGRKRKKIVKYMVEHSLFFSESTVNAAHEIMKKRIDNEKLGVKPFPVRKSTKACDLYQLDASGEPIKPQKNCYIYNQDIFGYKGMRLLIDKDGNSQLRQLINALTQAKPSQGASNSNIDFGKISHIWGQAFRPYMFTSLWNVVIVPAYLNDLLDKHADNEGVLNISDNDEVIDEKDRKLIKKIQNVYRCICWEKYNVQNKLEELNVSKQLIDEIRPDFSEFNIKDYRIVEIAYNFNSRCNLDVRPSNMEPDPEISGKTIRFPIIDKSVLNIFH